MTQMADYESLLAERFSALAVPDGGDWLDVRRRVRRVQRRRRLVALALAGAVFLAIGATPVGGAIGRGFGGFSAWLTGSPGSPASEGAQRAFEEGSARSWLRFPDGPKLRSLITTEAADGRFELFGFRSGDALCLRLTVEGIATDAPPAMGCAPLAELRSAQAPAVTVIVDYGFGSQDVAPNEDGYVPARASASFGVVADGVQAVELETSDGPVDAVVAGNAFLAVTENPPLGSRTKELQVTGDHGERVAVPLAEAPFGDYGAEPMPGVAPGPTKVERKVEGGTIGWLVRRELRGQSLEDAGLDANQFLLERSPDDEVLLARAITPDPQGHLPFVISLVHFERRAGDPPFAPQGEQVCTLVAGGGGCSPIARLFPPGLPFSVGAGSGFGGSQHVVVSGLASDDVERLELFLGSGERMPVPLEDNAFVAEVARLELPARLVAYDAEDRVIGIEAHVRDPLADYGPRPVPGKQRIVERVPAAQGEATLRLGPSNDGTTCFQIRFGDGRTSSGCMPKGYRGPPLALNFDRSGVVEGTVSPRVVRIQLRLEGGRDVWITPVQGVVLHGLEHGAKPVAAVGYDAGGREVGRQPFPWRPPQAGG